MKVIPIEDLTAEHLRQCGRVGVDDGNGAILVRLSRKLPPVMSSATEAPLQPEDLILLVAPGTPDPVAVARAAIDALEDDDGCRLI